MGTVEAGRGVLDLIAGPQLSRVVQFKFVGVAVTTKRKRIITLTNRKSDERSRKNQSCIKIHEKYIITKTNNHLDNRKRDERSLKNQ